MSYIVYFLVVLLANTIGAIAGMGGGIIIKPVLDAIDLHNLLVINFYSVASVFTMAIISLHHQFRGGFQIENKRIFAISMGSILGGMSGSYLFRFLIRFFRNQAETQLVQIILTLSLLGFVVVHTLKEMKSFHFKSAFSFFLATFFLGLTSSLLGIGGGPINVSILVLLFNLSMKQATVYSILTLFFSQMSALASKLLTTNIYAFDLKYLIAIIPAALIGGAIGSTLNQRFSEKRISQFFLITTFGVILLNFRNAIHLLLQ